MIWFICYFVMDLFLYMCRLVLFSYFTVWLRDCSMGLLDSCLYLLSLVFWAWVYELILSLFSIIFSTIFPFCSIPQAEQIQQAHSTRTYISFPAVTSNQN